jgi:hypothetical protein
LLSFPPVSAVELAVGRYSSQPPFDVAFSFRIPVAGWGTAHHHGEFFDVMQPAELGVPPTRWIAWARPAVIHGATEVDAAGMSPAELYAAYQARAEIELGAAQPYVLDGLAGLMFDMSTADGGVEILGGPAGDLQLDPAYEARVIVVSVDDAPLLVMVLAPRGELEAAWNDSRGIVDSIDM